MKAQRESMNWGAATEEGVAIKPGWGRERSWNKVVESHFNRVFGYYIEVTVPMHPVGGLHAQADTGQFRGSTSRLAERLESKILSAEELVRRSCIFEQVRTQAAAFRILSTARAVAELDVLASLRKMHNRGYVGLWLTAGLHDPRQALLFSRVWDRHVPNDIEVSCDEGRLLIITGPNMAGKSTVLATTGLITVMAQVGSFVPASEATIGICDAIYYRTGSYDDISAGKSSFMVELLETANILNNATDRSLILVDELGRGTSTYDGMALAWAVAEWVHDHVGARALFTTHYHELAALEERLPYARNYHVGAVERGGEVTFLYRLAREASTRATAFMRKWRAAEGNGQARPAWTTWKPLCLQRAADDPVRLGR